MWIFYSSSIAKTSLVLLLTLSTYCFGKKHSYSDDHLTTLLGDLRSAESEEKRSILKSLTGVSEDSNIAEESRRDNLEVIVEKFDKNKHPSYLSKKGNETSKVVQWHATPSRIVEHRIENGEPEHNNFNGNYNDNVDLNFQNSEYDNQNHHDGHYHIDHHHNNNDHSSTYENPNGYHSLHHQNNENEHDVPTSDVFYKKLKLKKVRRNCTRSKVKKIKKEQGWPERSDFNIEGRANNGIVLPHTNAQSLQQSLPALPESRFNDLPNPSYPTVPFNTMGFSGEHLHGIPRTHFFQYKDGEGVNHYHLHNHNHIYDANGKRINVGYSPQYRNLAENFEKLKSMLTTSDSDNTGPYTYVNDHYRSTVTLGDTESKPSNINSNDQSQGYHYTGPHESYGRKTYQRTPPATKTSTSFTSTSTDDNDKSIGMEMYRYGAGQYGTDEFSSQEDKRFYPNEVKYGIDKPYPNSREVHDSESAKPYSNYQHSPNIGDYGNHNSHSSVESSYNSYNSDFDHSYNHRGKVNKYNQDSKKKSPFDNQDKAPYVPQDKAPYVPQDKAPFTPIDKPTYGPTSPLSGPISSINGPTSSEFHDGFRGHQPDFLRNPNSHPGSYDSSEVKNGPNAPSSSKPEEPSSHEYSGPKTMDITHSVSYTQDGGNIETVNFGPENQHLYKNLRPEPDPLSIPKNAKIFEHYIRLHPMHYMYAAMARRPMNIPTLYGNVRQPQPVPLPKFPAALPKYPVPLHKLMPNPLKMPAMVPNAPLYPRVPVPQWNQMLPYQGRALPHQWW